MAEHDPGLVLFDGAMAAGQHQCELCQERPAVGEYGDAYSCRECYDEAELPWIALEAVDRFFDQVMTVSNLHVFEPTARLVTAALASRQGRGR